VNFDTELAEPPHVDGFVAIERDHADAPCPKHL